MAVLFHKEDITGFKSPTLNKVERWIHTVLVDEGFEPGTVNYIFCSDDFLLNINRTYLKHDYYTDIVTFDMSDSDDVVSADIFVSIDRVKENAETEGVSFEEELYRVMVHGVLHLCGYGDKTKEEQGEMRSAENQHIKLILG